MECSKYTSWRMRPANAALTITSMTMNWEKQHLLVSTRQMDAAQKIRRFQLKSNWNLAQQTTDFLFVFVQLTNKSYDFLTPNKFLFFSPIFRCRLFLFWFFLFARPNVCAKQEIKNNEM